MLKLYDQVFLTPEAQLSLLDRLGVTITDTQRASAALERIGRSRLRAYLHCFQNEDGSFRTGASFDLVLDLYVFDKKLRLIVLDALERIEIALRADIANLLGQRDPLAYRNSNLLHGNFTKKRASPHHKSNHEEWLERLDKKMARSKEEILKIHAGTDDPTKAPIWIAVELWDFGALSHFFAGMKKADRDNIAERYQLPSGEVLTSWLRCFTDIRNACAHHSRLWNRGLVHQPKWPDAPRMPYFDHLPSDPSNVSRTRIYAALVAMRIMLHTLNPNTQWGIRLAAHMDTLPKSEHLSELSAGFPQDWRHQGAWA